MKMIDTHFSNFFISELQASQISELQLTKLGQEKLTQFGELMPEFEELCIKFSE